MKSASTLVSLLIASLPLIGCIGAEPQGEFDLGIVQQDEEAANGLTQNGLTQNGLTTNSLTASSLLQNGLTASSLLQNGLVMTALSDPLTQSFFKYVVSCALPSGQEIDVTIDGVPRAFYGQLGLAPAWGLEGGACDASCQAWVSSCVLSRVNYLGETVPISMRGNHPALASSLAERTAYPNREAAYYGDIFSSPMKRFACTSPGSTLISRVCGPSIDGCIVTVVGSCDQVCGAPDTLERSFPNCHDDHGALYPAPVTIFRQ